MAKLNILWTTDSIPTITSLLSPYTANSLKNGWWDEIHIVIWGGSTKLISEDGKIQKLVAKMLDRGITIEACKYCADKYNASDILKDLGVTVKYMGKPLTEYIWSSDDFLSL